MRGKNPGGRTEQPLRHAGRRGRSNARYLRRLLFRRAELDHLSPLLRGNPLHAFAKVNGYIKLNYLRHNLFLPFVFCDFVLHRRYAGLSLMRGPATPIRTGSRPSHTIATFLEVPYTPRMTSSTWLFSITHWLHQLDARIVSGMRQGCHLNVKLLFATPHSMRPSVLCPSGQDRFTSVPSDPIAAEKRGFRRPSRNQRKVDPVGSSRDLWAGGGKKRSMSALAIIRISDRAIRGILPASLV